MQRTLWVNPGVGIAGDMLLGALIDVGSDEGDVRRALESLDVPGWELTLTDTTRRGLRSRMADVATSATDERRTWTQIDSMLANSALRAEVKEGARITFRRLAEVEAERHATGIDEVHFHEVGAVDAIVDIVGCWAALTALDVEHVVAAPIGLGAGTVATSHGMLVHPAPAVMKLLEGLPVTGVDTDVETATPTGVALLATMVAAWGSCPAGTVIATGFGAGGRDLETHPNIVSAAVIAGAEQARIDAVLIATTVDDVTPEILGHVIDRALAAGADDAWLTPVVMKKSRPGHEIRLLCSPALEAAMIALVAEETGTLGVRTSAVSKRVFPRSFDEVYVAGGPIRMKVGPHGAKPEASDVLSVAEATGMTARAIAAEAAAMWASRKGD